MSQKNQLEHKESSFSAAGLPARLPPTLEQRESLAEAMMAMAREPMAILDRSFRVMMASRSYHNLFPGALYAAPRRPFGEPAVPRWSDVALQTLTEVVAGNFVAQDVEIEMEVPQGGMHRMLLNAHRTFDPQNPEAAVLVGLQDVTDLRGAEHFEEQLAKQQHILQQEAHHRIANSLQIIASILLLKARSVQSEETRMHLRDVHKRLILVAAVQRQLSSAGMLGEIAFGPYLKQLCAGLADSMTEGDKAVTILTSSTGGKIKSDDAISFGLIITELVINALKHGFPDGRQGHVEVDFAAKGADWRLSVRDDGVGRPATQATRPAGLGTSIVEALARHLKATVEIASSDKGSSTTIVHTESAAHG